MAQTEAEKFIEHSGVKGMKWGVRKDRGHEGEVAKTKKIAKLDKKFDKSAGSFQKHLEIYNNAVPRANAKLDAVNNDPKYKDVDLNLPSKLRDDYHRDVQRSLATSMAEAAKEMGTNASGTKEYSVYFQDDGTFYLSSREIEHADVAPGDVKLKLQRDAKGHITKVFPIDSEVIKHTASFIDSLMHYGVKGMKWGVRKDDSADLAPGETRVTQKKPGTALTATGGKNAPAHEDAIAAKSSKQRAKASTTDALSNTELKKLVDRMNLEQQYQRLTTEKNNLDKGQSFVKKLLGVGKTANEVNTFVNSPVGQGLRNQFAKG